MWSAHQRRRDSESRRLPVGNAPERSPSPRHTTTARGLESGPPRVAEIPPTGAGDERGDGTLPPCATARRRGYVTNARALERAAPVAARGRRFPARRCTRPRPGPRRPGRPALGTRACRCPPYLSPAAQAADCRGAAASVRSVTASPGRPGPARAPARGSRSSVGHSPGPLGPRERLGPIPASNSAAARAASSPLATRLTRLAPRRPCSAQYPGRTARTPHGASPPREGSQPGRGEERRSRCGADFSRGFRRRAPTPREFSNFP